MRKQQVENIIECIIHVLMWLYIFASPLLFIWQNERVDWEHFGMMSLFNLFIAFVFYINYFYLIPRFVLRVRKIRWFIFSNVLLLLILQTGYELQHTDFFLNRKLEVLKQPPAPGSFRVGVEPVAPKHPLPPEKRGLPPSLFILRNSFMLVFAVGAAVLVRLSKQWRSSEAARQRAELGRSQAELTNLKNQINPHFLLNTLNNIYSLTVFDAEKAQKAIQELSRMLRYMLYENQCERVSLKSEAEFIQNYVALMKLRIGSLVEVKVDIDYPADEQVPVAPLIFISLIENAFKHGIAPMQSCYIHILLQANSTHLRFSCENSNWPKSEKDCAPGGIGLKQVALRLEHAYPGRYSWVYGPTDDGRAFHSEINIWDREEG